MRELSAFKTQTPSVKSGLASRPASMRLLTSQRAAMALSESAFYGQPVSSRTRLWLPVNGNANAVALLSDRRRLTSAVGCLFRERISAERDEEVCP